MNKIVENWENLGLLLNTPDNKKIFVANSLELLTAYLTHSYKKEENGRFETLLYPIFVRIGNVVEFNINDFFSIVNEVRMNIDKLVYSDDYDVELSFVESYSETKIFELNNN